MSRSRKLPSQGFVLSAYLAWGGTINWIDVGHWWPRVRLLGLEPKTYGLKVRCSTD